TRRATYRPLPDSNVRFSARSPAFQGAYVHLSQACTRLVSSGRVRHQEPEAVAAQLWSYVHGTSPSGSATRGSAPKPHTRRARACTSRSRTHSEPPAQGTPARAPTRSAAVGEPDEKAFGPADVAEANRVAVPDDFAADELRAVLAEPGKRLVDV